MSTVLVTFDAPELETNTETSYTYWRSIFSLLAFTGKVKWHREVFKMIKAKPSLLSVGIFAYYLVLIVFTRAKRVQTIFDILEKNDVKATFFGIVAGLDPQRNNLNELYYNPGIFTEIIKHGHELGLHGYFHKELTEEDMVRSIEICRQVLGITPKTYSTPWGRDGDKTFELLHRYGFLGWRVWKYDNDFTQRPYKVRYCTNIDERLLDELSSNNGVVAWNIHLTIYQTPIGVRRFKKRLKKIKERGIWTPTFSEFCKRIEAERL